MVRLPPAVTRRAQAPVGTSRLMTRKVASTATGLVRMRGLLLGMDVEPIRKRDAGVKEREPSVAASSWNGMGFGPIVRPEGATSRWGRPGQGGRRADTSTEKVTCFDAMRHPTGDGGRLGGRRRGRIRVSRSFGAQRESRGVHVNPNATEGSISRHVGPRAA